MKSRISFFNGGVAKNLLRRFWPLWISYLLLLLLSFPFVLSQELETTMSMDPYVQNWGLSILQNAVIQVDIAIAVAVLTAMAMYSYLYNPRICGMMNALPIRRETMFFTAFLTGLVPLLLAQVLAALLAALITLKYGLPFVWFLKWLGLAAMGITAFYGFAVFCAVLTGNILVLPAVYVVLNLTAVVAEGCVRTVLSGLRYGDDAGGIKLLWLSPIARIIGGLSAVKDRMGGVTVKGLVALVAYCAAGLILAGLALLICRRRHMECAGDVVAVPVLRPVFRWCMTLGTAFVFPVAIVAILNLQLRGRSLALLLLALLLAGAFLGWMIAEMLMQKTLKISFGHGRMLALACALLICFWGAAEFDLFGYERRVPEAEEVESVWLNGFVLSEPANVEEVTALHRSLISHKRQYDGEQGCSVGIQYQLKNGKGMGRSYSLPYQENGLALSDDLLRYQELQNTQEAIEQRIATKLPLEERYVSDAYLYYSYLDEHGYVTGESLRLTPAQAIELYREGILADAAEKTAGLYFVTDGQPDSPTLSNVTFSIGLEEDPLKPRYDMTNYTYDYHWFSLYLESEHCMNWIRENTAIGDYVCAESSLHEEAQFPATPIPAK